MDVDYQTLTDNELNELFQQIYDEQARRKNMRELPEQVVGLQSNQRSDLFFCKVIKGPTFYSSNKL